jgi:Nuclease A inhibitor-like protein
MLDATTFLQTIEDAARELLFPSESDFPIEPFSYGNQEPTPEALIEQRGLAADTPVEQAGICEFFEGLTETSEDASEADRACAERFRSLMTLLERNIEDVRMYRLGRVNIEVIVIGRHATGTWLGVRTNVVET